MAELEKAQLDRNFYSSKSLKNHGFPGQEAVGKEDRGTEGAQPMREFHSLVPGAAGTWSPVSLFSLLLS